MKRKLLSLLLALALLLTLLPQAATTTRAAATSGSCGDNLTWSYNSSSGLLTISGQGYMSYYSDPEYGDPAPWYEYRGKIKSVSLPSGLTGIGSYAFYKCTALSAVTFPSNLKEIGWSAFEGCTGLKSVTIPNTVTEIEWDAFAGCTSLSSVTLPSGLLEIRGSTFENCKALASITIPTSVKTVDTSAFAGCSSLRTVVLPKNVEKLGFWAFDECSSLKSLVVRNPACKVHCYMKDEDLVNGKWVVSYESTITDPLGTNAKMIIYGPHDASKENAAMMKETTTYDDWRVTDGYRYIENCAKTYGNTFYATNVFSDVKEGKFYEIPVAWAYGKGITSGKDDTHFAPNETCTRAQVVTFLWNAMGKPKATITTCPFVDVKPGKFYYDAMLWALQTGVTSGKDDTHFAPNETCTRAQVVTFLWNAMGKPNPTLTSCPFVDVKPGKFYYNAMLWALEKGITSGIDATHFGPNETCTRGQVVTFLYNTLT